MPQAQTQDIVAFRMPLARIETKLKLSQNRELEDRQRVIAKLEASDSQDCAGDGQVDEAGAALEGTRKHSCSSPPYDCGRGTRERGGQRSADRASSTAFAASSAAWTASSHLSALALS